MESTGKVLVPPAGILSPPATTTYERCVQITGSGEKPRIWWSEDFQEWVCWLDNHPTYPDEDVVGFGDTPPAAYSDWCAGMLTSEAHALGLYAAPKEAQ